MTVFYILLIIRRILLAVPTYIVLFVSLCNFRHSWKKVCAFDLKLFITQFMGASLVSSMLSSRIGQNTAQNYPAE